MNCTEVQEQLSALLDSELAESTKAQVEAHLAACAACARERDELLALRKSLRTWEAPRLNAFAASRIEETLRQHGQSRRQLASRWATAFAPALAMVAVILFLASHRGTVSTRPRIDAPVIAKREVEPTVRSKAPMGSSRLAPPARANLVRAVAPAIQPHRSRQPRKTGPSSPPNSRPAATIPSTAGVDIATLASAALAETTAGPAEIVDAHSGVERDLMDMLTETQ